MDLSTIKIHGRPVSELSDTIRSLVKHTSQDSKMGFEAGRAFFKSVVTMLTAAGMEEYVAIEVVIVLLPDDFSLWAIPPDLFDLKEWTLTRDKVTTFGDLLESMPMGGRKYRDRMIRNYIFEMTQLQRACNAAENPDPFLGQFVKRGHQYLAFFEVNDLSKPYGNRYNLHDQNTSQWVYAGCFCWDSKYDWYSTNH